MQNSDHQHEIGKIVQEVDSENSAQGIRKYFRDMKGDRNRTRKRWVWELLQNACDASATFATIAHEPGAVTFQHNGRPFTMKEAVHLIRHGSTKGEDGKTRGQFGSGFLTTHLLSPVIYVSGQTDEGRSFKFPLERGVHDSVDEIRGKIDDACRDLSVSLSANESGVSGAFTTEFRYPIENADDVSEAVNEGIKMLRLCAPLVIAFNAEIKRIDIKSPEETTSFEMRDGEMLQDGLQQITVSESKNGAQKNHVYILAKNERASVAVQAKPSNESMACCNMGDMPKLFLDFPLVGTENFSFPAIVNSLEFDPEDNRDGVRLKEVEAKSWGVLEDACALLIAILKFSASRGWRNVYTLTNIPDICERDWLNPDRLRERLNVRLVEKIHDTPVVIPMDETGPISPKESLLPIAREISVVESLWALWDKLTDKRNKLPRRDEVDGWRNAVKTWEKYECEPSSFDGAADGRKLASYIDEVTRQGKENQYAELADLERLLQEGVCAVEWLNQMHEVINEDGLRESACEYYIVLDQDGRLNQLSALHRDVGVADDLKDVAKSLEWNIRQELRDVRIDSLADESGAGDWGDKYVVGQLIEKLRARGDENPDDGFAKASVGIFKWIAVHKDWDRLIDFPAFAEKNLDDGKMRVIKMQRVQGEYGEYPYLAPVPSWAESLQHYSDLFPKNCVLATAFFNAVPDLDVWQHLNDEGFAKNCVIIKTTKKDLKPISDDDIDGEHPPAAGITVTDIAFLQKKDIGIMAKVPKSQSLARLFWRFLADWLLVQEPLGLKTQSAECADCKEQHDYPLAEWLTPVKENKWVPAGNRETAYANAESLGNLLRDTPEAESLATDGARNLLQAIGVKDINTLLFASSKPEHQETLLGWLGKVKSDEKLFDRVEKVMKDNQKVRDNQNLGKRVENLVKDGLADAGFAVRDTGRGSDIEIEVAADIGDAVTLELTHPRKSQTWLVEVKATSGNDGVKMTMTQAKEARDKGDEYLLCVVPLDGGEPDEDAVRGKMRFVPDIGNDVDELVGDFDEFKDRRDSITADKDRSVQLSISPGTERILVKKSVWEERGFPLDDLAERLKP